MSKREPVVFGCEFKKTSNICNIEVRSRKHYCREKSISIIYFLRVRACGCPGA
jgi:hypothetical protein